MDDRAIELEKSLTKFFNTLIYIMNTGAQILMQWNIRDRAQILNLRSLNFI
jgi:hypothetical protein